MNGATPRDVDASVTFGEYASPSFDAALASMSTAAQWNLLSIETIIDELYGDTKDDAWKAVEAGRIRELRGITTMDEPRLVDSSKPDDIIEGDVIDAVPASVSLNGAQMQSLLKIVEAVKAGTLSNAAAIALIGSSLPLTPEQAGNILQDSI